MFEVLGTLVLVVAASAYWFGLAALLVVVAASLGAVGVEWLASPDRTKLGSLRDGSALLTGVLLALTLPPSVPLWMAFLGGAVGVGLGKTIWGGLGQNLFNPALVGRAFLQAAFPGALTTWTAHGGSFWDLPGSTLAFPFARSSADLVTTATPLGLAKFESSFTPVGPLLRGAIPGSLGETAGWVLIVVGLYLAVRGVFDWRLAVSTLLTVGVVSEAFHRFAPETYPGGLFMIGSSGTGADCPRASCTPSC
jgi:electron transport complex protein RnfD